MESHCLPAAKRVLAVIAALCALGATQGWVENGTRLLGGPGVQAPQGAAGDGQGGAYIASVLEGEAVRVQHLTASGLPAPGWPEEGLFAGQRAMPGLMPAMVADGEGGVIVAWVTGVGDGDVVAQRFTYDGTRAYGWVDDGVPVCIASGAQQNPRMTSDGAGGAILAWEDNRQGSPRFENFKIYAQRLLSTGEAAWAMGGVALHASAGVQLQPHIVSDTAHGAYVLWLDGPNLGTQLLCQHLDASGAPLWDPDGLVISQSSAGAITYAGYHLAEDGAGGAIVFYDDLGHVPGGALAKRVTPTGAFAWGASPIAVAASSAWPIPQAAISDGAGGAILVWEDNLVDRPYFHLYAQHVDAKGIQRWKPGGMRVSSGAFNQDAASVAPDGRGGAYIAWVNERPPDDPDYTGADIYLQLITAKGSYVSGWGAAGAPVSRASGHQLYPLLAVDTAGAAIVTWQDERDDSSSAFDTYALRLSAQGAATPVVVSAFEGAYRFAQVELTWEMYGDDAIDLRVERAPAAEGPYALAGRPAAPRDGGIGYRFKDAGAAPDSVFYYRIAWTAAGKSASAGPLQVRTDAGPLALSLRLAPLPCRGAIDIAFSRAMGRAVELRLYSVAGREVRRARIEAAGAAMATAHWDFRPGGLPLPAGTYFLAVSDGVRRAHSRLVYFP